MPFHLHVSLTRFTYAFHLHVSLTRFTYTFHLHVSLASRRSTTVSLETNYFKIIGRSG